MVVKLRLVLPAVEIGSARVLFVPRCSVKVLSLAGQFPFCSAKVFNRRWHFTIFLCRRLETRVKLKKLMCESDNGWRNREDEGAQISTNGEITHNKSSFN